MWLLVAVIGILGVMALTGIYGASLPKSDAIHSDGIGYYLYLPALFIDRDITMERTAARSFGGTIDPVYGVRRVPPRQRLLDKYTVGEAIMLLPFFAVANLAAFVFGDEMNGFSSPYQAMAALAGLTFALLGLYLLGRFLGRWFGVDVALITLAATTFGTNLFHYATYDVTFSHAFSFFLVSVALTLGARLGDRPGWLLALGMGATLGLIALARPTNIVIVSFLALVGVSSLEEARSRVAAFWRRRRLLVLGVAAFLVTLVPQLVYWHAITGRLIVYSYGDEHLDLLRPHLLQVLLSVRKGLLFWSPLLVLALVGLVFLRRRAPELFLPTVVFLAVNAWLIASWQTWWYGDSFGQRPFVDALPVFAIGLAAFLERMMRSSWRRITFALVGFLCALSVYTMVAYWRGNLPRDGTTVRIYLDAFVPGAPLSGGGDARPPARPSRVGDAHSHARDYAASASCSSCGFTSVMNSSIVRCDSYSVMSPVGSWSTM
jgi:hypothetical protein